MKHFNTKRMAVLPLEVLKVIKKWLKLFKKAEYQSKLDHTINYFPVLIDIISLPIEKDCPNCNNSSDKQFYCCNRTVCEFCCYHCALCNEKFCSYCLDIEDSFQCISCSVNDGVFSM